MFAKNFTMSYLADIYRDFDAHFVEENGSIVSFPASIDLGSIAFVGSPGSGKLTILGQLNKKFKLPPGAARIDPDVQKAEIRNVIFKIPIVDCPDSFGVSQPLSIFENCKVIIVVVDSTNEIPAELLLSVNAIRESMSPPPEIHVFLNKTDMIDDRSESGENGRERVLAGLKARVLELIEGCDVHYTSMSNGTALLEVSLRIESLLPKQKELKDAMKLFAESLQLSGAFLVDFQSRMIMLSSSRTPLTPEMFQTCQDGLEMFGGIVKMMDSRRDQSTATVELKDGTFLHFFWSTYDVILVGISSNRIPSATAKNNVLALLHTIKRILK